MKKLFKRRLKPDCSTLLFQMYLDRLIDQSNYGFIKLSSINKEDWETLDVIGTPRGVIYDDDNKIVAKINKMNGDIITFDDLFRGVDVRADVNENDDDWSFISIDMHKKMLIIKDGDILGI